MATGTKGIGNHKHGVSGKSGKSPKMRHAMKREAEKDVRLDRTRIKNPSGSVAEIFKKK